MLKLNTNIKSALLCPLLLMCFFSFAASKPKKILLITGGCCHDYAFQSKAIMDAVSAVVDAEWTVKNEGGNGTSAKIDLYEDENWARPYDLVIHNECFADTKDSTYIRKITSAHAKGVNAIFLHCALHTYRSAEIDDWRQLIGMTSKRHDHQSRYPVTMVSSGKLTKGVQNTWLSPKDELYVIEKIGPKAEVLAVSKSEKDGREYPVAWTNKYGKAKIFGMSFGHGNETFTDANFIRLLQNAAHWLCK
ncbi:ThuA domain-containing protein [Pelobium manganitolerans]|nr:ThuA domain-containing protein [Pelobium manganitolerans]